MPRFCVRERDVINQNITLSSFYLPRTTHKESYYDVRNANEMRM